MNTESTGYVSKTKNVLICDTQPVAVEGMRWLIENSGDLRLADAVYSLEAAGMLLNPNPAPDRVLSDDLNGTTSNPSDVPLAYDAVVIDKALGTAEVMDWIRRLTMSGPATPVVVWGGVVSEAEALRLLQAGARGILKRTSESGTLLTCLRAVTSGGTWMEDGIFGSTDKLYNPKRSQLTARETEVVGLVEKGLRNRDIARTLGIQAGTVKIHLKHIFEKTGVRGRYGLALTGMRDRGAITLPPRHLLA